MQNSNQEFSLRPYTKKELRLLYNIPEHSFRRWIQSLPELKASGRKNWLSILEVEAIIKSYGIPGLKIINAQQNSQTINLNKVQ